MGGTYVKKIERPVRVTHRLLRSSKNEEVTDKMRYVEKFNRHGEANIRIILEEWFWDSLDFGGANVAPNVSLRSTHLLCPSGTGPKVKKARGWGIPVVDMSWLADIIRTGSIPPVQTHDGIPASPELERRGTVGVDPIKVDRIKVDRKGKGKEEAGELSETDSTNDG
ncbi:uncharacterized protein FIBRA_06843 [Fibroporia radiculosa]|uniref:BRCT domain-containing protein n=1 Tax=Fibroporia radiculosa TaxID=599839 RepID=J4H4A6_9APHY|nr:uncharacterized protein FIBRA_06843 [Fibroporia radiculosa]CCM04659.1 predicted protein [Fibroporia radiculosa]